MRQMSRDYFGKRIKKRPSGVKTEVLRFVMEKRITQRRISSM